MTATFMQRRAGRITSLVLLGINGLWHIADAVRWVGERVEQGGDMVNEFGHRLLSLWGDFCERRGS